MAETTTKAAAVWNPPRLRVLGLGGNTRTGTRDGQESQWETVGQPSACPDGALYRMPISAEPSSDKPVC